LPARTAGVHRDGHHDRISEYILGLPVEQTDVGTWLRAAAGTTAGAASETERLMGPLDEVRTGLRNSLRWLNRRRSLVALVHASRELLPGDSSFGDPMSTAGPSTAAALGRLAWRLQDGRFSLFGELALAGLQVADWVGEDVRGISAADQQTILFVDLRGFSQWALRAEDGDVAELLRGVDAAVTEVVEARGGVVVKRLGDGAMAMFGDCEWAVEAAFAASDQVGEIRVGGYRPMLRAGIHTGRPYRIGQDYVGVDVNIAARLCEAAPAGGVLVSGQVREELGDRWPAATATDIWLRGVPEDVSIYFAHEPTRDRRGDEHRESSGAGAGAGDHS
jgi:adenylate cyclase